MNLKLRITPANWIAAIFIFDCAVMPVIKIMGMSMKISYIIAFISMIMLFIDFLNRRKLAVGSANTILTNLFLFAVLLCVGEMWFVLFYNISVQVTFFKILIGIGLMFASLYYGYNCRGKVGSIAYWSFVANVGVNCTLALLGRAAPLFMVKLYSISLDTFIDGYYRNGGIIGNPNASLLVTNMVLLLVVVLYRYDKIKLSNLKLASLYLLSIVADIIVSSRGELLHTILILSYLTFWVVKKNRTPIKLFVRVGLIVVIIILAIGLFWGSIVERYPNIQASLDRMSTLGEIFDSVEENENDVDGLARPLLKLNVFWNRFRHSPIWGTGVDGGGNVSDFEKGTTGYHNDFFMILGASGILGLIMWIKIIKKAIKKIGICMIFPFVITAISNTFVRSYFGTMLYFFIIGYVLCLKDKEEKNIHVADTTPSIS